MKGSARSARYSPDERKRRIISVGSQELEKSPHSELWLDNIAINAGVSRALVYRYFGGRDELTAAVVERQCQDLLDQTQPDPTAEPLPRLVGSLSAYFDFAAERPNRYLAMYEGAAMTHPKVRAVVAQKRQIQRERILAGIAGLTNIDATVEAAVDGWLAFLVSVTLSWIKSGASPPARPFPLALNTLITIVQTTTSLKIADVADQNPTHR